MKLIMLTGDLIYAAFGQSYYECHLMPRHIVFHKHDAAVIKLYAVAFDDTCSITQTLDIGFWIIHYMSCSHLAERIYTCSTA